MTLAPVGEAPNAVRVAATAVSVAGSSVSPAIGPPALAPPRAIAASSFTSSYGAEYAWLVISVSPDSATRGPWPLMKASSQIGANIALSCTSCWILWRIASRFFASSSLACSG